MSQQAFADQVRQHFATLSQITTNGAPLVYLDNAATTHKPMSVINAINDYYTNDNANVHRGAHYLGDKATLAFEQARTTVKDFINAANTNEIIWTKGTTEAINLVAASWGQQLKKGDLIVLSVQEHHANIVPWQLLAQRTGAIVKAIRLNDDQQLDMRHYQSLLMQSPKLVAISQVSNATGTINPIKQMIAQAKVVGALTLIDGAQAVSHLQIDVQQLDCDFYAFSGHKLFGPTGIGVLYAKEALLDAMPPWQGGGEMIQKVSFEQTTYNSLPYKFEAGTPNIAGAIGLAAAIKYYQKLDFKQLNEHEQRLFTQAYDWMEQQPRIHLVSKRENNVGIIAFNIEGEHHQDIGTLLDQQGIAVRTGHHCTMPLMSALGINGTVRLSLSIYNNDQDIRRFIQGLTKILELLD